MGDEGITMNVSFFAFVYLLSNGLHTYVVLSLFRILNGKARNRYLEYGAFVIFYLSVSSIYLILNIPILTLTINIVGLLALSFLYSVRIKKQIMSVAIIYVVILGADILSAILLGYIPESIFVTGEYLSYFASVINCILVFMFMQVAKQCKALEDGDFVPWNYWLCIITIPIISVYLMISFSQSGITTFNLIVNIILLLALNFLVFFLYDTLIIYLKENQRNMLIMEQNERYANELELMSVAQQSVKLLKHDLKNHILAMSLLTDQNKISELRKYMQKLTDEIQVNNLNVYSGNMELDGIINYKRNVANAKGIEMEVDVRIAKDLTMDSYDLSVLLGNLLDNAIRATEKVPVEDKKINLEMRVSKNTFFLNIINPYVGTLSWRHGKPKTDKKEKGNHGLGLYSVEKVVKKYNGDMTLDGGNQMFHVGIMLYLS